MSDIVLKESKCAECNNFSDIRFFCFNCPELMCDKCKVKKHIEEYHDIIEFKSLEPLQWDNEELILDLFEDIKLGKQIFKELNRIIEDSDTSNESGKWQCSQCTTYNAIGVNKCRECLYFRKTNDHDGPKRAIEENKDKLKKLLKGLESIELGLYESFADIQFEHMAKQYLNGGGTDIEFGQWFEDEYLMGRDLALINEAVEKEGHNITSDDLEETYADLVKQKNDVVIKLLHTSQLTTNMNSNKTLIRLKDVNTRNIVPEDMSKRETTNDDLWQLIIQAKKYTEVQKRAIITEMNLPSSDKVDLLRVFVHDDSFGPYLKETIENGKVKLNQLRDALMEYMTIDEAMSFLRKECLTCFDDFPAPEMESFLTCSHEMCKTCFKNWLEESIERLYPFKWGCPECGDEKFRNVDKNMYTVHLRGILTTCGSPDKIIKIFDNKLLNETLRDSKNFHRCPHTMCEYGFETEFYQGKFQCPSCKGYLCLDCNRKWTDQHMDKTCQEYDLLLLKDESNIAGVLNDIGIECPQCRMHYSLAAGGCLHFDCKVCGFVFCGACNTMFTNNCTEPLCRMKTGFHGHHPRNCLYFLRDYSVDLLENMLQTSDYPKLKDKADSECQFMVTDDKLRDIKCKKPVHGTSGLCEAHYKEYLVQFINIMKIDPADYVDSEALNLMLFQSLKPKLEMEGKEDADSFLDRLKMEVKKFPLFLPKGCRDNAANV